jgi:very-short-patch-repair endonuclease
LPIFAKTVALFGNSVQNCEIRQNIESRWRPIIIDIVKNFMKKRFATYRKEKETLPLEGGGKRVGVKGMRGIAKRLRKQSTDTERQLWRDLRNRQVEGFKFRRQQLIGSYVVDFVDLEKKVIVELDGAQHALDPGDRMRAEGLRAEGYKVLRFWDNEVFSNLEGVLDSIRNVLLTPHPDPLPQGERGDSF